MNQDYSKETLQNQTLPTNGSNKVLLAKKTKKKKCLRWDSNPPCPEYIEGVPQ